MIKLTIQSSAPQSVLEPNVKLQHYIHFNFHHCGIARKGDPLGMTPEFYRH